MTSGEKVSIQPQASDGEPHERFNWDAPILVSPHKPSRLYFASYRVWKSENRGDEWIPISGDLTRNENRIELARIELYWVNGQKYSETYHVSGLKYKEILWYENGQKGMECKEVDMRGVNCKYWKKDGTITKEEGLSNFEENELFLEYRNRYF